MTIRLDLNPEFVEHLSVEASHWRAASSGFNEAALNSARKSKAPVDLQNSGNASMRPR
jgi:hypothetical protein